MNYQVPPDARCAASLLLLRDGESGLEVLMLRRAERDGDLRSGAVVFPGGVVDATDRGLHEQVLGPDDAAWSARLGLAEGGLDYAVAALRECFEEVGLLLAAPAPPAASLLEWRRALLAGETTLAELLPRQGLRLDVQALAYHSHWLTPPGLPRRFDTRFFTALAPAGQQAVPDLGEAQELMWLTPSAALEPARGLKLLPVTQRTLQGLLRFATAQAAHEEAQARREITRILPWRASSRRGPRIVLPDELPYAEVARLDPTGRGDASCELVPGVPVRLSPRVLRVTAPNPGPMTGPGTNSYLVGEADEWTVLDPGPVNEEHLQAVLAAAPGRITRILVTHSHVDHSPGAAALHAATGAPVLGRLADHASGHDPHFAPHEQLQHQQRITIGPGTVLRVVHTPGHASNHLCYLLEAEGLLFTGDHVMQGSTVVINPPDGDMAVYLDSLRALLDEPLQWLAPGHGFLVAEPHAVLRGLIAHRLRREAKVLQALQACSNGTMEELLAAVYADVPAAMHPIARRSLLAHLLKLQAEGLAQQQAERWSAGG